MARRDLINSPWPKVKDPLNSSLLVAIANSGVAGVPSGYLGITGGESAATGTKSYLTVTNASGTVRPVYPQLSAADHSGYVYGQTNEVTFTMTQGDYWWVQSGNVCTVTWDFVWSGLSTAAGALALYFDGLMPDVDVSVVNPLSSVVQFPQGAASTNAVFCIAQAAMDTVGGTSEPVVKLFTMDSTSGIRTGNQASASGVVSAGSSSGTVSYPCVW